MASKILSFICHVPGAVSASSSATSTTDTGNSGRANADRRAAADTGGHFTAIYENEKFVRFKYINH